MGGVGPGLLFLGFQVKCSREPATTPWPCPGQGGRSYKERSSAAGPGMEPQAVLETVPNFRLDPLIRPLHFWGL